MNVFLIDNNNALFARTLGAKDKQKRKSDNSLLQDSLLPIGLVGSAAIGGLLSLKSVGKAGKVAKEVIDYAKNGKPVKPILPINKPTKIAQRRLTYINAPKEVKEDILIHRSAKNATSRKKAISRIKDYFSEQRKLGKYNSSSFNDLVEFARTKNAKDKIKRKKKLNTKPIKVKEEKEEKPVSHLERWKEGRQTASTIGRASQELRGWLRFANQML